MTEATMQESATADAPEIQTVSGPVLTSVKVADLATTPNKVAFSLPDPEAFLSRLTSADAAKAEGAKAAAVLGKVDSARESLDHAANIAGAYAIYAYETKAGLKGDALAEAILGTGATVARSKGRFSQFRFFARALFVSRFTPDSPIWDRVMSGSGPVGELRSAVQKMDSRAEIEAKAAEIDAAEAAAKAKAEADAAEAKANAEAMAKANAEALATLQAEAEAKGEAIPTALPALTVPTPPSTGSDSGRGAAEPGNDDTGLVLPRNVSNALDMMVQLRRYLFETIGRPLTPAEYARLSGWNDTLTADLLSQPEAVRAAGNKLMAEAEAKAAKAAEAAAKAEAALAAKAEAEAAK